MQSMTDARHVLVSSRFGKYLEKQAKPDWAQYYLDYKSLKDLIKESAKEAAATGAGPECARVCHLAGGARPADLAVRSSRGCSLLASNRPAAG
jgi:hypothetical protein